VRLALLLAVAAGLVPGAGAAAAGDLVPLSAAQQGAFGIALEAPRPDGATLSRRYPGQVAVPNAQLRVVSAPQAGVIESLLVAEGERVEAGAELARLSSLELLAVQGDWLEALTRLELADGELERDRQLHAEGIIAERRLIETRARRKELATLADQYRQRLELSGLDDTAIETLAAGRRLSPVLVVRAPIGGVVLEQMAATGQSVAAAAPLYRLAELETLWVEVHVPVESLAGIAPGARVLVPDLAIEGRVITVGRMVHGEDQGVLVRAEVRAGAEGLRPGQFVQVQLASGAAGGGGWRVPAAALMRNAGQAYVFVARPGGFEPLAVGVIAEEEGSAVVSGPLDADMRLAVSGVAALKAAWLAAQDGE
jgi:RND family efflux transporter MFP subunit